MGAVAASGATSGIPPFIRTGRVYAALASAGFRRYATYRQATVAGAVTNTVFGFLRTYALLAIVPASGAIAGYDAERLVTFVWIGQGLIATVNIWGPPEHAERIRTGEVVSDLLRPVDPVWHHLAVDLGRAGYSMLIRFAFPLTVGALVFDLHAPVHWWTYPAFAASVLLAVLVAFGCRYLVQLSAYWLLDVRGPQLAWVIVSGVASGLYFPLWLLPDVVAGALVYATPFPSILQAPADIAAERSGAVALLGVQAGWAVAVLVIARLLQRRAERRLVIQGG